MKGLYTILYLNPVAEIGGAEKSLLDLLPCLDKEKYRLIVTVPSEGKLLWELERMGIETQVVPFHPIFARVSRVQGDRGLFRLLSAPWCLIPTIRELTAFVRSRDIDLMVTNGMKCHLIGSITSFITRAKLIWHVRDLVDTAWLRWMVGSMGRFFPDMIITNSHAVAAMFPNNERCETVYNGIDLTRFDLTQDGEGIRSEFGIGAGTRLLGTIGHFASLKGYEELMTAAKGLIGRGYDIKVVLVGGDIYRHSRSYKEKLLSLIGSTGLRDRVIFTGFREDIPELLASFDIFVLPSRSEGFGRVNLEAMAMARPVISTKIGGIPEVVLDGITGILVPPGDSEALSRAITVLLDNPNLRDCMGRAGRRRVEKYFSLQTHVRAIQEIYDGILGRAKTMDTSPQCSPMYHA